MDKIFGKGYAEGAGYVDVGGISDKKQKAPCICRNKFHNEIRNGVYFCRFAKITYKWCKCKNDYVI
jgi:hypothetical protein